MIIERLEGCARCEGDGHSNITFRRFRLPIVAGEYVFTHWSPCPTTGEPILLMVTETPVVAAVVEELCACGRELHGYAGPKCRYCEGIAE